MASCLSMGGKFPFQRFPSSSSPFPNSSELIRPMRNPENSHLFRVGFTSVRLGHVSLMTRVAKNPAKEGFTLVEVLVALAMAAVGFGVVLHSVGLQMAIVAGAVDRHQMLLYSSQLLETNLAAGLGEEDVDEQELVEEDESESDSEDRRDQMVKASQYLYSIKLSPVTADPRIQQVTATIKAGRGSTRLSAYRLRIQREQ